MKNEVKIALNICTFQREEFIHRNLSLLQASDFFNPDNPQYYGRLHIFVVDNGSSLQLPESLYVHCIYNRNTGGSGGFQRGIEEIRKRNEGFTHVIFMDDDVAFDISSFYLLFDFLSGVGEADRDRPVAGRMFCMIHISSTRRRRSGTGEWFRMWSSCAMSGKRHTHRAE